MEIGPLKIRINLLYYLDQKVAESEKFHNLSPLGRNLSDLATILLANYDFWLETAWLEILEQILTENWTIVKFVSIMELVSNFNSVVNLKVK